MALQGKGGPDRRRAAGEAARDRRHLVTAALPVGAVALTLLLGALLQAGPDAFEPEPDAGAPAGAHARATPAPEGAAPGLEVAPHRPAEPDLGSPADAAALSPAPAPLPPEAVVDPARAELDRRVASDLGRLSIEDWTLQYLVACEPGNVERQLQAVGGSSAVYLLPARIDGRDCYRLCYGRYASRGGAVAEMNAPAPLRGITSTPRPLAISEIGG